MRLYTEIHIIVARWCQTASGRGLANWLRRHHRSGFVHRKSVDLHPPDLTIRLRWIYHSILSCLGYDVAEVAYSDSPEPVMNNYSPVPGNENGCLPLEIDISDVRSSWANLAGISVFFLRIFPTMQHVVHKELERASKIYSQEELKQSFIIVGPGEYRIRRLPSEWIRLHFATPRPAGPY